MSESIKRRPAERNAFCRGCDNTIVKGEDLIYTYSFRNTGQNIYFCVACAKKIGDLVKDAEKLPQHNTNH
jgi:hypothetical protein